MTGIGPKLVRERRAAWERWYRPVAKARWGSAWWHTLAWAVSINRSGAALVTPSLLDGTWSVRVSIGAERTERPDVEHLWHLLQQAAAAERG